MSFPWPKKSAWIIASSLVLASVAALGWWSMRQPKLDERIYRIGYEIQPPLHFQTQDGRPTGFAVRPHQRSGGTARHPAAVAVGTG
jgi:hypothetical protein